MSAQTVTLTPAAREAAIDRLHLDRKARDRLRAGGIASIDQLIDGEYLSRAGWDALGRTGGQTVWKIVLELESFCSADEVDWPGFWQARGVKIVPAVMAGSADFAQLAATVPALVRAALADDARAGTDPERDWVIVDSRYGILSQPKTLDELGSGVFGLTRERVRQLESRAMARLAKSWMENFCGTSYRLNPAFDAVLTRLVANCAAVGGLVAEGALFTALGVPDGLRGRDRRLVRFLLHTAGLARFEADGARRPAMWALARDETARARLELADRLGHLLTEDLPRGVSPADIVVEINRGSRARRVTIDAVEQALPLSPVVELRADGRWQGRFEYLTRRGDQAYRLINAAGRPLELREVVREINLRSHAKTLNVRNLSNQLAGDDRFVPIGKSDSWGLAARDAAAAVTIPDLIAEVLRRAGNPLALAEIDAAVRARRPVGESSVSIYLATRAEFVHLPNRTWALSSWPEGAAAKRLARRHMPTLGERIAGVAIPYLKGAAGREAPLRDVVSYVHRELDVPADNIYQYFGRHPAFERADRDGRKLVRLVSEEPTATARPRKSTLADRMAGVLVPYLESAPGRQRELGDVVRLLTREIDTIPATVYGYLSRIPGVERVNDGDRRLVRLVSQAAAAAPPAAESALESMVRGLIARGETPTVEFKSTLMWSTKGNVKDPKLQKMVTKTLAAFANTRGGTLLIGVEPDGAICGTELDCAILKGENVTCVDAFSRSLAAITAEHLGPAVAAHLATHYVDLDGKTLCIVDVKQSLEPVYLRADGVTEVYVRNGTTTTALPVIEIANYIRSHWS